MDKRTLVVFYSRSGNTRRVGREIAQAMGGDVEEIIDRADRAGALGFLKSCIHGARKGLTEIDPVQSDPGKYALVVIGTPIWAGTIAPAVRTWLTQVLGRLPAVAFFSTSGGGGDARTIRTLAKLTGKDPIATALVRESDLKKGTSAEKIAAFVRALKA